MLTDRSHWPFFPNRTVIFQITVIFFCGNTSASITHHQPILIQGVDLKQLPSRGHFLHKDAHIFYFLWILMESPPFGHHNECSFKSPSISASNFRPLDPCSTYRHGGGAFGNGMLPVTSWKSQCFCVFDAYCRSIWINNLFSTRVPHFYAVPRHKTSQRWSHIIRFKCDKPRTKEKQNHGYKLWSRDYCFPWEETIFYTHPPQSSDICFTAA